MRRSADWTIRGEGKARLVFAYSQFNTLFATELHDRMGSVVSGVATRAGADSASEQLLPVVGGLCAGETGKDALTERRGVIRQNLAKALPARLWLRVQRARGRTEPTLHGDHPSRCSRSQDVHTPVRRACLGAECVRAQRAKPSTGPGSRHPGGAAVAC